MRGSFPTLASGRSSAFRLIIVGSLLVLSNATTVKLDNDDVVIEEDSINHQQQTTHPRFPHTGDKIDGWLGSSSASSWSAADKELAADIKKMDQAESATHRPGQDGGEEMLVKFRQANVGPKKTRWVELSVEVLGPDGKTNTQYSGGVAASLILADQMKVRGASRARRRGFNGRAVQIATNVANRGRSQPVPAQCSDSK